MSGSDECAPYSARVSSPLGRGLQALAVLAGSGGEAGAVERAGGASGDVALYEPSPPAAASFRAPERRTKPSPKGRGDAHRLIGLSEGGVDGRGFHAIEAIAGVGAKTRWADRGFSIDEA